MARNAFSQLASLGEEVLGKAAHNPTAARMLQGAVQLKERVDDLSKRVRGLEQMEKRLAQLEKRIAKLEGSARKPAASRKPAAAKKSSSTGSKPAYPPVRPCPGDCPRDMAAGALARRDVFEGLSPGHGGG